MIDQDEYYRLYKELAKTARELEPYYDIDKVKDYSVYVWTKPIDLNDEDDFGENVFDIKENKIVFYVKDHVIIEAAIPIIKKIQERLREIRLYCQSCKGGNV